MDKQSVFQLPSTTTMHLKLSTTEEYIY